MGVAAQAIEVVPGLDLYKLAVDHWPLHYLVCDEAQFYTAEQCDQLARVVDDLGVDVFAFGLITDFRGELFEGTKRLLEIADERVPMQVEARCWCGARATHNARVVNGEIVYEGETVVVGDTGEQSAQPLFGDVVRPQPMTVDWITYAQSLTGKPVKGWKIDDVRVTFRASPRKKR